MHPRNFTEESFPTYRDPEVARAVRDFGPAQAEAPAVDTAKAFDELEAWITRGAGGRACWCLDKVDGKWKVGLEAHGNNVGERERLTAGQDRELRGAIRNALMIAMYAGYR